MMIDWKVEVSLLLMISNVWCQGMPGAPYDADMTHPDAQEALKYALLEHNKETNDNYRVLLQVVKAQKQVVAGILYKFTVKMVKSQCKHGDQNTVCRIFYGNSVIGEPYLCTFEVISQPWLHKTHFKSECKE